MTQSEKLEKLIGKAIEGGWKAPSLLLALYQNKNNPFYSLEGQHVEMVRGMITGHDFAKALFGEEDKWYSTKCSCGGRGIHMTDDTHAPECDRVKADRGYKFHLQQAVISDDPIDYMYQAVFGGEA